MRKRWTDAENRTTPCRGVAVFVALCAVFSSVFVVTGCRRVLFRADDDRTPYARYDRVRADEQPPYLQDEFGRRVPNLRGRLLER